MSKKIFDGMNKYQRYIARYPGRRREIARRWREANVEKWKMYQARSKERARKLREEVLAVLGGVCRHCGFADARALQVDHVNGDAYKERKSGNSHKNTGAFYAFLLKEGITSGRFQLLCANCNWIKRVENGEYDRGGAA